MDVDEELESCVKGECTLIQCKVGPMRKDEVLTFKIRSRLFEETQIKVMFSDKDKFILLIEIIIISNHNYHLF